MSHRAFILGAGLGQRLRPLTEWRPKPTVPIMGRPMLEYVFEHLKSVGVQEVVMNTHHCPEVYQAMFGFDHQGLKINYSFEPVLLDTGGGIKKCEAFFKDGTFIVYNGDILTDGDLASAIHHHQKEENLATMILTTSSANPNVALDERGKISDLRGVLENTTHPKYSFSGIHILEPALLEYIPPRRAVSIVDVYLDLIRQGKKIGGFLWPECYWQDIGDIRTYRKVQEDLILGRYRTPFPLHRLGQDGSDRLYYRTERKSDSLIVMHYGKEKKENAYYVDIACFLKSIGLSVPVVEYSDPERGIVWVEDLGDLSLCHAFGEKSRGEVLKFYEEVIQEISKLHREGASQYQKLKFQICPPFTERTYLWESSYFEENCLKAFFHFQFPYGLRKRFDEDCKTLAELLSKEKNVLIHRDLQSKNIMMKNDHPYLIDFQGMRLGLPAYDLASLLWDPYVSLRDVERSHLFNFYLKEGFSSEEAEHFIKIYLLASLQRLMQALGAYGFLGLKKGKKQFLEYIPVALARLSENVEMLAGFEGLKETLKKVTQNESAYCIIT
ncbi:MAG: phosphotransferase [Chlamydiae bacterium]|nr:phosphotransferase [Chlamydiota bacterium]MBI3276576.1 phosphotransferase [Chlamydiota bacterium]